MRRISRWLFEVLGMSVVVVTLTYMGILAIGGLLTTCSMIAEYLLTK